MNKEKTLKIIKSIAVIFLFDFSYLFQYIPLYLFKINKATIRNDVNLQILFSFYSSLIMTIILLVLYRKDLIEEFKKMKGKVAKNLDIGLACWATGLIIMAVSNIILMVIFKSGGANNENAVQAYIKALPWLMGIDICLVAPFNEEIVFRKTLKDIFNQSKLFIITSFLLFGYVHVSTMATNWIDWLYIIPYGSLGAAFALAYQKTDTVFTSMTFHSIHNTFVYLLSIFTKI